MSILTITLNPAIDATYVIGRFRHGQVNRIVRSHARAGGKGNNVARVLAARGHEVVATGFLGGATGRRIEVGLRAEGIATAFTWLPGGESRTCHTVLEAGSGIATEFLEPGPAVTGDAWKAFGDALPALLARPDMIVVSGSAPAGMPGEFLDDLAGVLAQAGPNLAIDTSGHALAALLGARPALLKPNGEELQQLVGGGGSLGEQVARIQAHLIGQSLSPDGLVLVSLGEAGAMLVSAGEVIRCYPPRIAVVNPVGSGDALLAGFIDARLRNEELATCLANAVAMGTAACLQEVAGVVDQSEVERIRRQVRLGGAVEEGVTP